MYIVGLMSGTSLDGVYAALVRINEHGTKTKLEVMEFIHFHSQNILKRKLLNPYQWKHRKFS